MSAILERPASRAMPSSQSRAATVPTASEFDSHRLLQGRAEVLIRHGGEVYRLRHTRNDKLILTK